MAFINHLRLKLLQKTKFKQEQQLIATLYLKKVLELEAYIQLVHLNIKQDVSN